jgi:hypothetical protein
MRGITHAICVKIHGMNQGGVMTERKDTSVRINELRRIRLEKTAIKISYEIGRQVKMSDLVNHLIDNYLEEAAKDMKQGLGVSK